MEGWVRVLHPFNSISVISRRWKGEHERLCTLKRRLGSGRISPPAGFEPVTPWSEVGSANRSAMRMLHVIIGILDPCDAKTYHIKCIWVSDLHFMVQWFCPLSWRLFVEGMLYRRYWFSQHYVWPTNIYVGQWPKFCGSVILPLYIQCYLLNKPHFLEIGSVWYGPLTHTCQLFENFMGEKARKWPFSTDFLSKAVQASKVLTISMGEMFGNFIWFKGKILKIQQKIEMPLK